MTPMDDIELARRIMRRVLNDELPNTYNWLHPRTETFLYDEGSNIPRGIWVTAQTPMVKFPHIQFRVIADAGDITLDVTVLPTKKTRRHWRRIFASEICRQHLGFQGFLEDEVASIISSFSWNRNTGANIYALIS